MTQSRSNPVWWLQWGVKNLLLKYGWCDDCDIMTLRNKKHHRECKGQCVTLSPRCKWWATFFLCAQTRCAQGIISHMLLTFLAYWNTPCLFLRRCGQESTYFLTWKQIEVQPPVLLLHRPSRRPGNTTHRAPCTFSCVNTSPQREVTSIAQGTQQHHQRVLMGFLWASLFSHLSVFLPHPMILTLHWPYTQRIQAACWQLNLLERAGHVRGSLGTTMEKYSSLPRTYVHAHMRDSSSSLDDFRSN